MTRRIVQIAVVRETEGHSRALYALDNNGIVWVLPNPSQFSDWKELPALPREYEIEDDDTPEVES